MNQDVENQEVINDNNAEACSSEENVTSEATDNMSEEANKQCDKESQMADQAAEWKDKFLRLSAEFDNYRKRTLQEKMDLIENGGVDVIKSVLSVVDDFDRATLAAEKSNDIESLKSGLALIHKRLNDILKQKGVTEIEAMGGELDTDLHDAIAKFPVEDEDKKGKVIDVVEKGYKLKDKVIRFSKVVVGE